MPFRPAGPEYDPASLIPGAVNSGGHDIGGAGETGKPLFAGPRGPIDGGAPHHKPVRRSA